MVRVQGEIVCRNVLFASASSSASHNQPALKEKIDWLRESAGDRFPQLELNSNLTAVGQELPDWLAKRMNITLQQLIEANSASALTGDVDHMCEQLLERREVLGVSYITAGDMFMDTLALPTFVLRPPSSVKQGSEMR